MVKTQLHNISRVPRHVGFKTKPGAICVLSVVRFPSAADSSKLTSFIERPETATQKVRRCESAARTDIAVKNEEIIPKYRI